MAERELSSTVWNGLDLRAALWAGLIAGAVFLVMEMILVATVGGGSMWGPPRMMAAMLMGESVLPPPANFDALIVMVAMIIHIVLSIVYALILGFIFARWEPSLGLAVVAGGAFGLLLYFVNFYGVASLLFPWFAEARNWISWTSHIVYGVVLAWSYMAIERAHPAGQRT